MQDQPHNGVLAAPNAAPGTPKPITIEDAVGSAFVRLLADTRSQGQRDLASENRAIQAFVQDVRRRKAQPHGAYDGFLDLAATAAVRVLVYGVDSHDEGRKDPASLTLYRKMRWLVKYASTGTTTPAVQRDEPPFAASVDDGDGDGDGEREFEAIEHQEILDEAYDSGYSAGFEAGMRAEAAKERQRPGRLSYAEGFDVSHPIEQDRVRKHLGDATSRSDHNMVVPGLPPGPAPQRAQPTQPSEVTPNVSDPNAFKSPHWISQSPERYSPSIHQGPAKQVPGDGNSSNTGMAAHGTPVQTTQLSQLGPVSTAPSQMLHVIRPRNEGDSRYVIVSCVFCGRKIQAGSLFRHKKRRHAAELVAAGVDLPRYPCWWPGCGMLEDCHVPEQLSTHLQRKHNFTHPGDTNDLRETVSYIARMPKDLLISIISEAAQGLNAVKERIQSLESQLRIQTPSYVSRHRLPDLNHLHETREPILSSLLDKQTTPLALQELRQLMRARGMRSQLRNDEGTWWEVADDLEAALNLSGALAQAVAALPPPDEGPTMPMSSGTLVEGPYMNDPSWKPQYAPPMQASWGEDTYGKKEPDEEELPGEEESSEGFLVPPDTVIPRTNIEIVIPFLSRPASISRDSEDNEDERRFEGLIAEIQQRVMDDDPDVDWNDTGYDESEETSEIKGDNDHAPVLSTKSPSQRKRRTGTFPSTSRTKRHKAGRLKR